MGKPWFEPHLSISECKDGFSLSGKPPRGDFYYYRAYLNQFGGQRQV